MTKTSVLIVTAEPGEGRGGGYVTSAADTGTLTVVGFIYRPKLKMMLHII